MLRRRIPSIVCGVLLATLLAPPASAREVRVPLTVGPRMIRDALVEQVFDGPDKRAVFWGEPGECSFFYLEDPKVESGDDGVRVTAHGEARLGTRFLGGCFSPIVWSGTIEVVEQPRMEEWAVRFDVSDSNLYDEKGEKSLLTGGLWDRIKASVHPRFGSVRINLGGPFQELRALLPLIVALPDEEAAAKMLDSLRPVAVAASASGVTVDARVEVALPPAAPEAESPEAPLSEEEIEAFTARLDEWDAFLTFSVRELARQTLESEARDALLAALLESRHEIVAALGAGPLEEDPVRRLFVSVWEQLRPAASSIARGLPGGEALRVVTFVAAADALVAFDELGPGFGVEISSNGLRRMARMVGPDAVEDPLEFTPFVDPRLRRFLDFGAPLAAETSRAPALRLVPVAWAAAPASDTPWKGWTYTGRSDVAPYVSRVGKLIHDTIDTTVKKEKISGAEGEFYRRLLRATAWQESCWRQFSRRKGEVTYLRSSLGSVGVLQINERVWRGFYDVEKLRWQIGYNAGAGAEILHRYYRLVQGRKIDLAEPGMARAIYATYNGGPGQLRRYLSPTRSPKLANVIDQLFGKKFDTSPDAVEAEVARCLVGG